MHFEEIKGLKVLQLYPNIVTFLTLIVIFSVTLHVIQLILNKKGCLLPFVNLVLSIFGICIILTSIQPRELMNGETTTEVQSIHHANNDKITKVNISGHTVKFKDNNELKKGDHIHIKAKNAEIKDNKLIKNNDGQSFKYEKVNK